MTSFNLIDEPWILVTDLSGAAGERSIREVLCEIAGFASIGGDIPTQQFAITRILLAIVRRAVGWGDEPLERWRELWKSRALPETEISRYLDAVHDRFDLLDREQPFYQVSDFETARDGVRPIALLISDLPSKHRYFTTRAGSGAADLSLAEAARWIVHTQAYDASGIKTGDIRDPRTKGGKGYPMGIAWPGQLGGVLLEGKTLVETLLLNTVLSTGHDSTIIEGDLPVWEKPQLTVATREKLAPTGPLDVLTWQSRRIRVTFREGRAVGVIVGNGDPIESHRQMKREYLTGWRHSANKSKEFGEETYYPRPFDADRSVWEGFESLLVDVDDQSARNRGFAPAVIRWLDKVVDEGIVDLDAFVSPHTFGLRYDTQASVVGAAIDDRITLRTANFGLNGCRRDAIDAVRTAEVVARAVAGLARDLAVAAGGEGGGDGSAARIKFLAAVDIPYRGWLTRLGVEPSDALRIDWHTELYRLASGVSAELIQQAGRPAFIGRIVTTTRGTSRWMDSAVAEQSFRSAMRRELTGAFASGAKGA